jgi:hypothetical protein
MSTLSEREEALRRALFSAAQSIEPAADGFERIQARLSTPRPTLIAWIEGVWSHLLHRSPAFIEDFARKLSGAVAFVWDRFGPTPATSGRRSGPLSWLRPAAAMTVAIFVVAAGAYVGLSTSDFISQSAGVHSQTGGGSGQGGKGGGGTPQSTTSSGFRSGGSPSPTPSSSSSTKCKGSKSIASVGPEPSSSTPASGSTSTSSGSTTPTPTPTPTTSTTSPDTQSTQDPSSSGSQRPPSDGGPVTTAYQHYAAPQCGSGKKNTHRHSAGTAAKITGTVPGGTVDVIVARLIGKPAS